MSCVLLLETASVASLLVVFPWGSPGPPLHLSPQPVLNNRRRPANDADLRDFKQHISPAYVWASKMGAPDTNARGWGAGGWGGGGGGATRMSNSGSLTSVQWMVCKLGAGFQVARD